PAGSGRRGRSAAPSAGRAGSRPGRRRRHVRRGARRRGARGEGDEDGVAWSFTWQDRARTVTGEISAFSGQGRGAGKRNTVFRPGVALGCFLRPPGACGRYNRLQAGEYPLAPRTDSPSKERSMIRQWLLRWPTYAALGAALLAVTPPLPLVRA